VPRAPLPIRTDRLELRPFAATDHDAFAAMRGRDDVARYLLRPAYTPEEASAALVRAIASRALDDEGDVLDLVVERRADGEFLGDVLLIWRSAEHGIAELGAAFHPDHHGQGYAAEAASAVLRLAFEELGFHRVVGRCHPDNAASRRLMERIGMRREGHFVRSVLAHGAWTDELAYAILDDEWAARAGEAARG
jgi:RimJ/RimL family protein N-acetyltransferase